MVARVLLGSEGVRVSKPGINVNNWGADSNLSIHYNARCGQILEVGSIPLTVDFTAQRATGRISIGPYSETPDVLWQLHYSDAATRFPPAVWGPIGSQWLYDINGSVKTTRSAIVVDIAAYEHGIYDGGLKYATYLIYQIMRKAKV